MASTNVVLAIWAKLGLTPKWMLARTPMMQGAGLHVAHRRAAFLGLR